MAVKAKGINAERDLIHLFWSKGIAAVRVEGSGSSKYPSPDLIVGKGEKKLVIECKAAKESKKYFTKEEIDQLRTFSEVFGAKAIVALKFNRQEWAFLHIEDLKNTGKCFLVDSNLIREKGVNFENMSSNFI